MASILQVPCTGEFIETSYVFLMAKNDFHETQGRRHGGGGREFFRL